MITFAANDIFCAAQQFSTYAGGNARTVNNEGRRDADAVQTYMLDNFGGYAREQYLERLDWTDEYAEVRVCQITMEG